MNIKFKMEDQPRPHEVRVGMVYAVKGGDGRRHGHMFVLIAMTEDRPHHGVGCLLLRIDKAGNPVGVASYSLGYLQEQQPIAFAEGVDKWSMTIRGLG